MKREEYIEENAAYARNECIAALEMMDDDDFAALAALNEELAGDDEPGISSRIVMTAGDVSSFDDGRRDWRERGSRKPVEVNGRRCVIYRGAQTSKGQQRRDLAIMPWGDGSLILEA